MTTKKGTLYIISDGTGETASAMIRAAIVQYRDQDIKVIRCKNIRNESQVENVIEEAFQKRGLIVYTVVNTTVRKKIKEMASDKGIPHVDLLSPLLNEMDAYFEVNDASRESGILRTVDERYFKRIEAIEYTVKHDDGKTFSNLDLADIILVGISRTSKTPLSIFLSHKGWKVANIPMVLNQPLPEELFEVDQRKVVALVIDQEKLIKIRRNRLQKYGQDPGGEYASSSHVNEEIEYSLEIFRQNKKWPVFNVTERALEETATEITRIVAARMGLPDSVLF